ncbi:MAG: cytochrome c3 family protein [Nitrospirota bacterium]
MTNYTSANGRVICLSCHRAHGSAQNDLLRFDYSTMNAGNSTNNGGCETCHVAQR